MELILLCAEGDFPIQVFDCPKKPDTSWLAKAIGCEWIEIVRPVGFDFVLIVDEEGLLNNKPINCCASYLYGTHKHGHPIVGNALMANISEDGSIIGFPDEKAMKWMVGLGTMYDQIKKIIDTGK